MTLRAAAWALLAWLAASPCAAHDSTHAASEYISAQNLLGNYFGRPCIDARFDYVVVGGGTAGLTVAARLAEAGSSVAVVEAGGFYQLDNGNRTEIPADPGLFINGFTTPSPLIDWGQLTTPQTQLDGRVVPYNVAKTLGGGSARNYLWYQKSAKGAYKVWADAVGDRSYEYNQFDPFFKRSVDFHAPDNARRPANSSAQADLVEFHPSGGPLQVSYPVWINKLSSYFSAGMRTLRVPEVCGFIDGNLLGFSFIPFSLTPRQVRATSSNTYLHQALRKGAPIQVYKNTIAKQVLFTGKQATGVLVNTAGLDYTLHAGREVIVSAGAIRSPQLLMVSGIGPASTLQQHGISVRANLTGVGKNFQDHISVPLAVPLDVLTHSNLAFDPSFASQSINSYNQNRTGILTNPGGDILSFEKLSNLPKATRQALDARFPPDWPHVEIAPFDVYAAGIPPDARNYVTFLGILVAPFSRGTVTISSNDTATNPVLDPGYFTDKRDDDVALAAFRRMREYIKTHPFDSIVAGPEVYPGAEIQDDAALLTKLKAAALSISHAAGTCAMGRVGDANAVVDANARVMGVTGLRVVDASVFPVLPPGHPQGTVYALAEKIADQIIHGGAQ